MQHDDRTMQVSNEEFIPIAVSYLTGNRTVNLPLKGSSMRPFVKGERDTAILATPHAPVVGEPVLALLPCGQWVLHRIVAINGDDITLQGDGNLSVEHCKSSDIKASVIGFYRKGRPKPDLITSRKWRLYSALWLALKPLRRILLKICCL